MNLRWVANILTSTALTVFLLDGLLTIKIGTELNPVILPLFTLAPVLVLFLKIALSPFFVFLNWHAKRNSPLALLGLVFILGWYASLVVIQTTVLVTGTA